MLAVTFAQYETNYRVPRKDLVTEMAKILNVNPLTLHEPTTMDASELMEILFWIDEFNPTAINLFQLETYPGEKCNSNEDTAVRYHDSDNWPQTCDDCGKHEPKRKWRSANVKLRETYIRCIFLCSQRKSTINRDQQTISVLFYVLFY